MIRHATFEDIPAMLEIGRRAHAASRYREIVIDEETTRLNVASMIVAKGQCVFVAEEDGKIVGMLLGVTMPWFFSREPYAADLCTFAEKPGVGRALVRRFVKWAIEERRVPGVEVSNSFGGSEREQRLTEKMYERMGFERVGSYFALRKKFVAVRRAA